MKILHILDHSLPLHSGYAFRSLNIFRAQRKRGWHPVILTSPKHEVFYKKEFRKKQNIDGFTYYRTGTVSHNSFPLEAELRFMCAVRKRILEIAEIEKPNILHAHSPVLNAIPALWAGREVGIPVVYEIRAFWEDAAVDHRTYSESSWKYGLVRFIETWACRKADQIAVLCNGLKTDLIKRGIFSQKITPVFNGINPDDFKPCPPDPQFLTNWNLSGKRVIGFIGSFYRYEGLDLLVKAFSEIAEKHPDVVLLLVGGGEVENELKALSKHLDLSDRIIMPGRVPHERVPGVYALVDILAYPRYSMRLTDLVTPLKPLEAMAMGKALVASDVGGHQDLIRHKKNGMLFPANNLEALATSLAQLLENDALRQKLETESPPWVRENHTWEITTSVYQKIYERAMRSK